MSSIPPGSRATRAIPPLGKNLLRGPQYLGRRSPRPGNCPPFPGSSPTKGGGRDTARS